MVLSVNESVGDHCSGYSPKCSCNCKLSTTERVKTLKAIKIFDIHASDCFTLFITMYRISFDLCYTIRYDREFNVDSKAEYTA